MSYRANNRPTPASVPGRAAPLLPKRPPSPVNSDEAEYLLEQLTELRAELDEVKATLVELRDRLPKPVEIEWTDLDEKIVDFLERTGMRANPPTIAANIGGLPATEVGARARLLVKHGRIDSVRAKGSTSMYFALTKEQR